MVAFTAVNQSATQLPTLRIDLFDQCQVAYGDQLLTDLKGGRLQSLLCLMALNPERSHARCRVAALMWPESSEAQARTNLRQLLHNLRTAMPAAAEILSIDAANVRWRDGLDVDVDVRRFKQLIDRARQCARAGLQEERIRCLDQAAAIYRGDLLPTCYDEWLTSERDQLRQDFISALRELTELAEAAHDLDSASAYAQRLLVMEPTDEASHRTVMRCLAAKGHRTAALHAYHRCVETLATELDVQPDESTQALYRQLLAAAREKPCSQAASDSSDAVKATQLTGRRDEWLQLLQCWRRASQGRAQLALVSGELGAGKTRLCEELIRIVQQQGFVAASAQCFEVDGGLPYGPLMQWLKCSALREHAGGLELRWRTEIARLAPDLLPADASPRMPAPSESWQRQHFFEALARAFAPARSPLLLFIDDLHACDTDTLSWLRHLLRFKLEAPLLVLATMRGDAVGQAAALQAMLLELQELERLTHIPLRNLSIAAVGELTRRILGVELDDDSLNRFYRQTAGNPLFVVETARFNVTRRARSAGDCPLDENATSIPPRVETVIRARLAGLPADVQELASLAAAVGRPFSVSLLMHASELPEDRVLLALDTLWVQRIVREHDTGMYAFVHDQIRAVAYGELGPARKTRAHISLARALEAQHGEDLDAVSDQLARHYERAGLIQPAVANLHRAALSSLRVYANEDAIRSARHALKLLRRLPLTRERERRELDLLTVLGPPLVIMRGYGVSEVVDVYRRARNLAEALGYPPSAPSLRALAIAFVTRSDLDDALATAHELLRVAHRAHDTMLAVEGNYSLGVTTFWRGELLESRSALAQALAHCGGAHDRTHIALYSQSPAVICLTRLAFTSAFLGELDQALEKQAEAERLAADLGHPYSRAYASAFGAWLHCFRGDFSRAEAAAEATLALCTENAIGYWSITAHMLRAWCRIERGEISLGFAEVTQALDEYRSSGQLLNAPLSLYIMARAHLRCGRIAQARACVDEALELVERLQGRWVKAELLRQLAEIQAASGESGGAVAATLQAGLAVAREQRAGLLEGRLAAALAEHAINHPQRTVHRTVVERCRS